MGDTQGIYEEYHDPAVKGNKEYAKQLSDDKEMFDARDVDVDFENIVDDEPSNLDKEESMNENID